MIPGSCLEKKLYGYPKKTILEDNAFEWVTLIVTCVWNDNKPGIKCTISHPMIFT